MDNNIYKIYHRNYNSILELYDDLSNVINDICLEDNLIRIKYVNEELKIEFKDHGFVTYVNDKKEKGIIEDKDIYYTALEFAHDNIKSDVCEIPIYTIVNVTEHGIEYEVYNGRKHFLDFNECCKNLKKKYPSASENCVGERNILDYSFSFYTDKIKKKVVFFSLFKFKKRKLFLQFQKKISDFGFKTFDLS